MARNMERGARIVIEEWMRVKPWDKLLIVTTKDHLEESRMLRKCAVGRVNSVNSLVVEDMGRHVGVFFDMNEEVFDPYTAVIAATDYSLVTTKAAKRAIQKHKKFLSLPLSTNDGRSMLEYEFHKVWDSISTAKAVPYDFRHNYAIMNINAWTNKGFNFYDKLLYLSKSMGHTSLESTKYYYSLSPVMADILDKESSADFDKIVPEVLPYE